MENKLIESAPEIDDYSFDIDLIAQSSSLYADHAVELIFVFFYTIGATLQAVALDTKGPPQFHEGISTFFIIIYMATLICMLSICYHLLFPQFLSSTSLWSIWIVRTSMKSHKRRFAVETALFASWSIIYFLPVHELWLSTAITLSLALRLYTWYIYLKHYMFANDADEKKGSSPERYNPDRGHILLPFTLVAIVGATIYPGNYLLGVPFFTFEIVIFLLLLCSLGVFLYFLRPIRKISVIAWLCVAWFFANLAIPHLSGLDSFIGNDRTYLFPATAYFDNGNYTFKGTYLSIVDSSDWYNDELTLHDEEHAVTLNSALLSVTGSVDKYEELRPLIYAAQGNGMLALIINGDIANWGIIVDATVTIPVIALNNTAVFPDGWWSCYRDDIITVEGKVWSYLYLLAPLLLLSTIYITLQVSFLYKRCISNAD